MMGPIVHHRTMMCASWHTHHRARSSFCGPRRSMLSALFLERTGGAASSHEPSSRAHAPLLSVHRVQPSQPLPNFLNTAQLFCPQFVPNFARPSWAFLHLPLTSGPPGTAGASVTCPRASAPACILYARPRPRPRLPRVLAKLCDL